MIDLNYNTYIYFYTIRISQLNYFRHLLHAANEADVEHSAELTADTITPMLLLDPDNSSWSSRALDIGNLTTYLWTGLNSLGSAQFKSSYLSSQGSSTFELFACDTAYHSRVLQPLALYWQQNPGIKRAL